jgi:hypothetical protein
MNKFIWIPFFNPPRRIHPCGTGSIRSQSRTVLIIFRRYHSSNYSIENLRAVMDFENKRTVNEFKKEIKVHFGNMIMLH